MFPDARTQVDLIVALNLEGLFKMGHLGNAGDQSDRLTRSVAPIPHSKEYDSLQLRRRLAIIRNLAVRAPGLTIKTDMAQDASTRRNDDVFSQSSANAAARGGYLRRKVW
jgi:hypothetical protein